MNPYLLITIGGLLGVILHVFVTMQTINKATPLTDFHAVWRQYWKSDYWSLVISVLVFIIYVFTLSEWIDMNNLEKPDFKEGVADRLLHFRVSAFIKTSSIFVGYFADYLIYKFIGKAKKIIDQKITEAGIDADSK